MTKEELYRWVEDPGTPDETMVQELETVLKAYPCFHTAQLLFTKGLEQYDNARFGEELAKTAVVCSDRRQLLYLIRSEQYAKLLTRSVGSDVQTEDRTEALLDSYLSTLSQKATDEVSFPDEELQIAGTDYFAYLASLGEVQQQEERESQPFQHQAIIDAFIEKAATDDLFTPSAHTPGEKVEDTGKKEDGGEFLTETLARIYIKQQKYEQALTIIKRLSLNFPKKSVYFADQIRFLEYLIANEKNKK